MSLRQNPLRDPQDRRLPRIAGPCSLILFGVTGDLARKKLIPAVYDLANRGLLPPGFALVGFARQDFGTEEFAEHDQAGGPGRRAYAVARHGLEPARRRHPVRARRVRRRRRLGAPRPTTMRELDEQQGTNGNHAFYLSIPPALFPVVVSQLKEHGLADGRRGLAPRRHREAVRPRPQVGRELNGIVADVFPRECVFRIDHYLGKETVQNILAFRFANGMFEPIWNGNYVDHVQITMAEDIGIGTRAGYYDGIGAARDVIQNHLLQLMALIAMEEPVSFKASSLRMEKQKILANARPAARLDFHTAHAQYVAGWAGGEKVVGYLEEQGIPQSSTTETYAAMRIDIATRRWAGVPFYLRTGKRLGRRVTEVAVVFKRAPHQPFAKHDVEELGQNALVMRIQPDEGVTLRFGAKVPGTTMEIRDVLMDFAYGGAFVESSPEAYERLILDVLLGDPPLFPQHEEVELAWEILDPVIEHWSRQTSIDTYTSGTWGPASADEMIARDGRAWRRP